MHNARYLMLTLAIATAGLVGCTKSSTSPASGTAKKMTIGVTFETLNTEYWVAGFDAIKAELANRDIEVLEAIADRDPNRQQVKNFITRREDGIIMVPKDAKSCIPAIRFANEAKIPIVLFNRLAGKSDTNSVAIQADNFQISKDTVAFLL